MIPHLTIKNIPMWGKIIWPPKILKPNSKDKSLGELVAL